MPQTPNLDTFSEGMGESVGSAVSLGQTVVVGGVMRPMPEPKFDSPRFGIRIAPFGNARADRLVSQLPHLHFRVGPRLGESYPHFGWKWHHPWEDIPRIIDLVTQLIVK